MHINLVLQVLSGFKCLHLRSMRTMRRSPRKDGSSRALHRIDFMKLEARSFNEHKDNSRFGISGVLVPTSTSPSYLDMQLIGQGRKNSPSHISEISNLNHYCANVGLSSSFVPVSSTRCPASPRPCMWG